MSTVKVAAIQHPSAATAAITLDAAGGALIGGQAAYARNLLYNGAMQVSQRGTSTTGITTSSFNTADRWAVNLTTLGTWTQDIQADAPTGSGFRNSLRMLCTTADAAPAAGDVALVCQILEGQDCQRIAKGTSSARQLTLSFWVKSNVTGTYVAEVSDDDNTRAVSRSYTINASATWERKTITFPADTTGAIANDNTSGMRVNWWLGAGSTFTSGTLATTWASTTSANRAVGQTNLAAATNNYWQVTGVQLEVGPAATPFEFKPFGQELRECQRYYEVIAAPLLQAEMYVPASAYGPAAYANFAVTKRAVPDSFTIPTPNSSGNIGALTATRYTTGFRLNASSTGAGNAYWYFDSSDTFKISAEL